MGIYISITKSSQGQGSVTTLKGKGKRKMLWFTGEVGQIFWLIEINVRLADKWFMLIKPNQNM